MKKTTHLYPGQGSQYVGMGKALYEAYPQARAVFAQADEVLGIPVTQICFEGPEDALTDTVNTQPAILTVSVATLETLKALDLYVPPAFVAGHSMGEFSALVAAGALSFGEALQLVRERGRLMKLAGERQPGGMAAIIGLDMPTLTALCAQARQETGGVVQVANDNCPGQAVISGDQASLDLALEKARAAKARRIVPLAVSIAAHSPLMAVVASEFAAAVDAAPISDARIPLVANVSAAPLTGADKICTELKSQLTSSLRWTTSMQFLVDQGITEVVEIGPKAVLTGLMKRIDRQVTRVNWGDEAIEIDTQT